MAKSVPRSVGVQVSRGDYTKVPTESVVWKAQAAGWPDFAGVVPAEGGGTAGRALHGGACPSVPEHSAQVQRGSHDRFFEGQECRADSPGSAAGAADDGSAFLGHGLLREHRGLGRAANSPVHSRTGETGIRSRRT